MQTSLGRPCVNPLELVLSTLGLDLTDDRRTSAAAAVLPGMPEDLNANGEIDMIDLAVLLGRFGEACPG